MVKKKNMAQTLKTLTEIKFYVLINHNIYGNCYVCENGQITKNREIAKIFLVDSFEDKDAIEKTLSEKYGFRADAIYI